MKTLNLSEIGRILMLCVIICMGALTGCSEDEEIKKEEFTFPELTEKTMTVGETLEISFNATEDWTLSSKDSWCKFINGDFEETIISGNKGEQKITAKISNPGDEYIKDHNTEISLKMGDKEQTIYKITIQKKVFEGLIVKSVPEEGEEAVIYSAENPIVIKGCDIDPDMDGKLFISTFTDDASLTVGVKDGDNPSWVNVVKTEDGFELSFNRNNIEGLLPKNSIKGENAIKFSIMASDNVSLINEVSIPVEYEGLKEGLMSLDKAYGSLSVSVDGMTFTEMDNGMGIGGNDPAVYNEELVSNITTRDDKFHVLVGSAIQKEQLGAKYYVYDFSEAPNWVMAETNGTKVNVHAGALLETEQRGAIVLVLTESEWNAIKDLSDPTESLVDVDEWSMSHYIKQEYADGVMALIIQEPEKQASEKITFKGFFLNEKVTDWSTVKESQLEAFEDGCIFETTAEAILEAGYTGEIMAQDALYYASAPYDVLKNGGSICLLVENAPDNYMLGAMENPWYNYNTDKTSVTIEEQLIEGKRYVVLTGTGEEIPEVGLFSIMAMDIDYGICGAECFMGFY